MDVILYLINSLQGMILNYTWLVIKPNAFTPLSAVVHKTKL
jgi:hypothetical protein